MPFKKGQIPWNKGKKNFLGRKHPFFGTHLSEETKRKIRESIKGRIPGMKGKHHSEETKRKLSKIHKERLKDKRNHSFYGKHHSEKTKQKMSEAHKGQTAWNKGKTGIYSKETITKIREGNRGKKHSLETRIKIGKSSKGRIQSSSTKRKRSISLMGHLVSKKTKDKISCSRISKGVAIGKNNPMWNKEHSIETKKKISKANKGRFIGSKSPRWKGGPIYFNQLIRTSPIYKLWREAIFHKDKFQCQDCGKIGGNLHAHHIYSFAQLLKDYKIISLGQAIRTEELWDINNGLTLCKKCHRKRRKRNQAHEKIKNLVDNWYTSRSNKTFSDYQRTPEISEKI